MAPAPLDTPPQLRDYVRDQLRRAVPDAKHPWHWPVLATGASGRVVVLRHVTTAPSALRFYTDRRSRKVAELSGERPVAELTFYHGRHRVQLRCAGEVAELTDEDLRRRLWDDQSVRGRRSYAGVAAPGSPVADPSRALPPGWADGQPSADELEAAYANFVVYELRDLRCDVLVLRREGQRRALFAGLDGGDVQWVVP